MKLYSPVISGSLTVSGSTTFIGNITMSGSLSATASNASLLEGTGSVGFTTTGSFTAVSSSQQQISSSLLEISRSYATTGSNTFTGVQNFSNTCNPIGFNSVASLYTAGGLQVSYDSYFSSSVFVNGNLTVFGTQSVVHVSSSQFNIGTNIITVNTATPSIRYGGLSVYDSGSTGLSGSILWDSEANHWIYANASGSGGGATYSGGMFISGPRSSGLGCEQGTTSCMLLVGQGGDHLTSSMIYHSSTCTNFYSSALFVSSSGNVGIGTSGPSAYGTQKFLVVGTGAASQVARFTDGANADLVFDNPSEGVTRMTAQYGTAGTLTFAKGTSFVETMRITGGGYVGIGATTPVYNLHVCCSNNVAYIAVETGTNATSMEATILQKTPDGISLIALGASPARGIADAARCDWSFGLRTGGCLRFSGQVAANNTHFLLAPNGVACFAASICAQDVDIRGTLRVGINQTANTDIRIDNACSGKIHYIFSDATTGDLGVEAGSGTGIKFNTSGPSTRLYLNSSGIACFSCQICTPTLTLGLNANNIFTRSNGVSYSRFLYSGACLNILFTGGTTAQGGAIGVNNFEDTVRIFNLTNDGVSYFSNTICSDGTVYGANAGCFKSKSDARVLYLRQTTVNTDNIIQFLDHNGANIWEVVGRNQQFYIYNGALGSFSMCINPSTNAVYFPGAVSKGSGTFNIEHPLDSKKCTHRLVHSFIEGPQADLIYRGKINLENGIACVNVDCASRMTEGTFEALNRCAQVFTTNESSWDAIRGKLYGNILVIESENTESQDEISWMVIGERQDKHIKETSITDSFGRIIVEPEVEEQFTCICQ